MLYITYEPWSSTSGTGTITGNQEMLVNHYVLRDCITGEPYFSKKDRPEDFGHYIEWDDRQCMWALETRPERFAFISGHEPTPEQYKLAGAKDITLIWIGDLDAFTVSPAQVSELVSEVEGVVVVHPAAALRLALILQGNFKIGVFENGVRLPDGGKPTFFAKALHIYG